MQQRRIDGRGISGESSQPDVCGPIGRQADLHTQKKKETAMGEGKERVKVGLIGCGRIANTAHLPAIEENEDLVELISVADCELESARKAQERYRAKRFYGSIPEALNDSEIEAVIICLPHDLHRAVVIDALKHGKHVLVEKPLALSIEEADQMIEAAETNQRNLMVGQNRRFFQAVIEAQKRMGDIGKPLHIVNTWFHFRAEPGSPWWVSSKKTGGLLIPLNGSHAIDTVMWLTKRMPKRVFAQKNRSNPKWEGEDDVSILLGFDDGLVASISLSFNSRVESYSRYIIGSKQTMFMKNDGSLAIDGSTIVEDEKPLESFKRQLLEFAVSIREKRAPIASGRDVRALVKVLSAVTLSARENKVITL